MRLLLLLLLRRPTTGVLLAAGLLGALVAHPAAAAKPSSSLFQRVTRSLQNVGSVLTGGGGAVDGAAAAAAMEDMGGAVASMLEAQAEARAREGVDTWATDKVLQLASQAFKGDQLGVLRMMGQAEGLKEIWADPEVARNLLTHFKMFRGIKKMAALADKEGPLTSEDGLAALGAFQEYIQASASALEGVLDPGKFASKIHAYQNTQEPALRSLFQRVETGDVEAVFALQEELVKRELGDLVDMEEFGLRGEEPAAVAGLRSMVKEQDPEIYRLIVSDDAIVQRFMADPARAWKDAQGISSELAEVAGKVTSGSRRARRERERRQLAEEAEPVAA